MIWADCPLINKSCFRADGWEILDNILISNTSDPSVIVAIMLNNRDFTLEFSSSKPEGHISVFMNGVKQILDLKNHDPLLNQNNIEITSKPLFKSGFLTIFFKLLRSLLAWIVIVILVNGIHKIKMRVKIEVVIAIWIFCNLFLYVLLFPPIEFWPFMDRFGLSESLRSLRISIVQFFYDYISMFY